VYDLNGFCSKSIGHFVTSIKGSGLFHCNISVVLHMVRKEQRKRGVYGLGVLIGYI
jgi:hypothetical protein